MLRARHELRMFDQPALEGSASFDEGALMIAVFDYGAGNLRSVENALEEIGCDYQPVRDAAGLRAAGKIVLPGVGHFGQMMRALDALEVRETLIERIAEGAPFFGICLGLQALFETSEEAPEAQGLGIFPGIVRRFPAHARVPHMGWDEVQWRRPPGLRALPKAAGYFYFAHSFYVPVGDYARATCFYEIPFTAALQQSNVFGVQFHPEKSGAQGLRLLEEFAAA
jgi:imidazole glycerol phosphate synthase glutamine amidotransferase subunit